MAKPDDTHVVGFAKNSKVDTAATNGVKASLVPVDVGGGVEQEEGADAAVGLVGRTKHELGIDTVANSVVGGKTCATKAAAAVVDVSPALGVLENLPQPAPQPTNIQIIRTRRSTLHRLWVPIPGVPLHPIQSVPISIGNPTRGSSERTSSRRETHPHTRSRVFP